MIKIVLDPGHGGPSSKPKVGGSSWNNATGPNGLLEKTVTLKVAKAAQEALASYPVEVVLTRTGDTNLAIAARAEVARSRDAEVFVSIHFNAPESNDKPAQGTETWINPNPTAKSRALAEQVQSAVVGATGHRNRGVKDEILVSGVLRNEFHSSATAHCLVEISFLSVQPDEEALLKTDAYIAKLGKAVGEGILAYFYAAQLLATTADRSAQGEPEDAASARAQGLLHEDAAAVDATSMAGSDAELTEATADDQRMRMAALIVGFEARRVNGKLAIYEPPGNDGGGKFEVAGINVRYHPDEAWTLRNLIEDGRADEAEALARDFIAQYTDRVASWSSVAAIEFYLRDCAFNRGPTGAARILQMALGVGVDGVVGAKTRAAIAGVESQPLAFLDKLREAREDYERDVIGVRDNLIDGLTNRWNKSLTGARSFLTSAPQLALLDASSSPIPPTYYPHWATANGTVTDRILSRLPVGTIIGAHHAWEIEEIKRILDFPEKAFVIAWYAESNTLEPLDDVAPQVPVADRIAQAKGMQLQLLPVYGEARFSNLFELDAAREKKLGGLADKSNGNKPVDWIADATAVRDAGFRYLAKSPSVDQVGELRAKLGDDFVPRIVFEDVTAQPGAANPGYREDAKALAAKGFILTLIVHEAEHGDFPGTTKAKAQAIIDSDYAGYPFVEALWGRETNKDGFFRLKEFAAPSAPQALTAAPQRFSELFADQMSAPSLEKRLALNPDMRAVKDYFVERYLGNRGEKGAVDLQSADMELGETTNPNLNVVGVGIGRKITDGGPTDFMAVRIYVKNKFDLKDIPAGHLLPKEHGGVLIDVVETGLVSPQALAPNPKLPLSPAVPGCSIGFDKIMAGTFGALVRHSDGRHLILSNSHVLADQGRLTAGAPIYQPGLLDLLPGSTKRQIARLLQSLPIETGSYDAALAEPLDPNFVDEAVLMFGRPKGTTPAANGMIVRKFGRTTSSTEGDVDDIQATFTIPYRSGVVRFTDLIVIRTLGSEPFSKAGDSGSLILSRDENKAVGLLFAGSDTGGFTLAHHIEPLLQKLKVSLYSSDDLG